MLIEVGHARVGAASAGRVSRPEHGTAMLGIAETRREGEVPQIGALQHESIAIPGVTELVGHRHEDVLQARLPARRTSRAGPGGRNVLHTDVLKYSSVKSRVFGAGRRFPPVQMSNYNHLLGKVAGVDGLKSGVTNGAGFCLTATAARNGRRVIAVVMGSPDWRSLDLKVAQLIEHGFAAQPVVVPPVGAPDPAGGGAAASSPTRPPPGDPTVKFSIPGAPR